MKLELAVALASLLTAALPAPADQAPSVPQPAPTVEVCPDALQRSQCRQRCSPAKTIFQPCAAAEAGDPASCRDDAIERCLQDCLAHQCRPG